MRGRMKRVNKGGSGELTEAELNAKTAEFKAAMDVFNNDENKLKRDQVEVFENGGVPQAGVLTGMMKNTGLPIFTMFVNDKQKKHNPLFIDPENESG